MPQLARSGKIGDLILSHHNTSLSISDVPRALAAFGAPTNYLAIWRRAVAGDIPARRHGGRWVVDAADLPAIAEILRAGR